MKKYKLADIFTLCLGFAISGIGASLYVYCDLGSDAFNVLVQGVARVTNLREGNAFYLLQFSVLLLIVAVRRSDVGIGSVLGTVIVGSIMNLWGILLAPLLQASNTAVRLGCLMTAPVFIGFGIAFARRSGLGMVPNDSCR